MIKEMNEFAAVMTFTLMKLAFNQDTYSKAKIAYVDHLIMICNN